MKRTLLFLLFCLLFSQLNAQKYFTKNGVITFNASSPLEPIEGTTRTATSEIDLATGNIAFSTLIKSFLFPKALMQEHFNNYYMESNTYPKSVFKGKIENFKELNFAKDGTYRTKISGNIEIHGVSKPINSIAEIVVKSGRIIATANFVVNIADYNITIPSAVKEKIAKTAKINITTDYQVIK